MRHKLGHLIWWLGYLIDPKFMPTHYCSCRDDPDDDPLERTI